MLVAQLLAALERHAPAALAEEWDNVGLMVGRHNRPVRRMLVALELRDEVVHEAREGGCDTIVVHHPPIFPSLAALTDDTPAASLVLRAAEHRIAVVAAHTNLDSARGGLNDLMAQMLGIHGDLRPLRPVPADPEAGLGRVGAVEPTTLAAVVAHLAATLPGPVTYTGDPWALVARVACCTGSGASLIGDAEAAQADVYVTGDLKYHDADRSSVALIDVPHAGVEREMMRRWTRELERELAQEGVEVRFAAADTDPWQRA